METRSFTIEFLTPAFLGNARQSGQWRTPPIKALLRQWWRMAYAAQRGFKLDTNQLRLDEGLLFGAAADGAGNRSLVRLRLDRWDEGKLKSWNGLEPGTVAHPEVQRTGYKVGAHAYLGFGPLDGRGGTKLAKANAAIQATETAQLSLAFPQHQAELLDQALWLMGRFGTLGGRSRNGWGSFVLRSLSSGEGRGEGAKPTGALPLRDWRQCLQLDWPHALGKDQSGPLIWQTQAHGDWKSLMRELAEIKIGLRTHFRFNAGHTNQPEPRHWLSYPVTNHSVRSWGNNARLPNSLRFKVRTTTEGQLTGAIFHVPCQPPASFQPQTAQLVKVWGQVHACLDGDKKLKRSPQ
jgi:CRISPR-associated protein Cmr1